MDFGRDIGRDFGDRFVAIKLVDFVEELRLILEQTAIEFKVALRLKRFPLD